jgi:hypothetical protein
LEGITPEYVGTTLIALNSNEERLPHFFYITLVNWQIDINVSEKHAVSIFRMKECPTMGIEATGSPKLLVYLPSYQTTHRHISED